VSPRARAEIVRPRLQSDAIPRPLDFTVRPFVAYGVVSSSSYPHEHRDASIRSVTARPCLRTATSNKNVPWNCCCVVPRRCGGVDIPALPREWANPLRTNRPRLCGFHTNLSVRGLGTDRTRISVRIRRRPNPPNRADGTPGFDRRTAVLALDHRHGAALCRGRHVMRKSSNYRTERRVNDKVPSSSVSARCAHAKWR
jgi:hypothetical protein